MKYASQLCLCVRVPALEHIATSLLSVSQQRLVDLSHNVANMGTAGFKARTSFQTLLEARSPAVQNVFSTSKADALLMGGSSLEAGQLSVTNHSLDLAITSAGFFSLSDPVTGKVSYSRSGSFLRDEDGFLTNQNGHRVQSTSQGDIRLSGSDIRVDDSGLIFEQGRPVDRIGVFMPDDPSALRGSGGTDFSIDPASVGLVADARLRQGALEMSNVSMPEQMIRMMEAIHQAETGSRIMQTYDTLLGQAISAFGRG